MLYLDIKVMDIGYTYIKTHIAFLNGLWSLVVIIVLSMPLLNCILQEKLIIR